MQPSIMNQISQNSADYGAPDLSQQNAPTSPSNLQPFSVLNSLSSNQPQQPVESQQPTEKGNWLTHILPTALSIGGGLLGTLADPFTAGMGTFAGGAAGSALGKSIQDSIEGKNTTVGDLAGAAGEGLLGAGLGKVAGAGLSGIGKIIGGVGEKGLAKQAATKTAEEAFNNAQTTRNVFAGVKPSLLKKSDLAGTQKLATNLGVDANSPLALSQTAQHANDILNDTVNGVLSRSGPIDTNGLNSIFKNAISKNAGLLGKIDAVALSKGRMGLPNTPGAKLYSQLQDLSAGIANRTEADPVQLREMISKVGSLAADAKPGISATTGAVDPSQKAIYNTLNDIYGQLKDTLYNRPSVASEISALKGGILPEDVGGNSLLANHLNDVIENAKNPQDIIDSLAKFTNMSNIGNAGLEAAKNPATVAAVNAAKAELPTAEGGKLSGTPLGDAITTTGHPVSKLLGAALNIGSNGGRAGLAASNLGSTLQRISAVGGLGAGETIANSPNYVSGPANANTAVGTDINQTPTIGSSGNVLQDILESNSPNTAALKLDIINAQHRGAGPGGVQQAGIGTAGAQELQQLQAANSAEQQLRQYISLYNQAGGAQGPIGGLLNQLGSTFTGGPAAQLAAEREQIAKSLSQLTGGPVNLPTIGMNQDAANSVLAQLQSGIGSYGAF